MTNKELEFSTSARALHALSKEKVSSLRYVIKSEIAYLEKRKHCLSVYDADYLENARAALKRIDKELKTRYVQLSLF